MRSLLASALILFQSFGALCQMHPSTAPPYSLLWRIQGNTLQKPCYLFGTMHLTSRKIFYFQDSLYAAIEKSDGFAMEVHPDSLVALVYRHVLRESKDKMLRDVLSKDQLAKVDTRLKKELGISADKISAKDAMLLRQQMAIGEKKPDDMPTFVDEYLYSIAKDQEKRIAGLEQAQDQEALLEDMENKFDPARLADDDGDEKKLAGKMVDVYSQGNLAEVDSIADAGMDGAAASMLYRRNRVMLHSMDSLFRTGSFFVAVGAAHLGGDSGLIQLLRREGYSVEAVLSAKRLAPGSYVFRRPQEKTWTTVHSEEEGYELSFPGPVQDMPIAANIHLKMYADLTTNTIYEAGSGSVPITAGEPDSLLDKIVDNLIKQGQGTVLSKAKVSQDTLTGIELELRLGKIAIPFKFRIFISGSRYYFLAIGAQKKDLIEGYNKDRFFSSLSVFKPIVHSERKLVTEPEYYCSFVSPQGDKLEEQPELEKRRVYTLTNPVTGVVLTLGLSRADLGSSLQGDTASLYGAMRNFKASFDDMDYKVRDTLFLGQRAIVIEGSVNKVRMRGLLIKRENYQYAVMAYGQNDSMVTAAEDSLAASFRLLPFGEMPFREYTATDTGFTVFAPAITLEQEEHDDAPARLHQPVNLLRWSDTVRRETYSIDWGQLGPYIFAGSDTAFLHDFLRRRTTGDSILRYTDTTWNGLPMLTYFAAGNTDGYRERGSLYLAGNRVYTQRVDAWPGREFAPEVSRFFDSIRFKAPATFTGFPAKGSDRLLEALRSDDSVTVEDASAALDSVVFTQKDLPALLGLYVTGNDTTKDASWIFRINRICRNLVTEKSLPALAAAYRGLRPSEEDKRYQLLSLAALPMTQRAMDTVMSLLAYRLPTLGYPTLLVEPLIDSPSLARGMAPRLARYQGDSLMGLALFRFFDQMVDSGYLSLREAAKYEPAMLDFGYAYLQRKGNPRFERDYWIISITGYLERFRDTAVRAFLTKAVNAPNLDIKFNAASTLLSQGYAVPPRVVAALASDDYYRAEIYDSLDAHAKTGLFPPIYRTRQAFAKSAILRGDEQAKDDDDEEPFTRSTLTFIKEGVYTFKGKKEVFLLFRAKQAGDDKTYLGIAGPYAPGSRALRVDSKADYSGIYYGSPLNPDKMGSAVKAYLDSFTETADGDE